MESSRITIFSGHYGSGKTSIAINYALMLAKQEKRVAVCDLDIVNPYFRTRDAGLLMEERGIRLISSRYANTNIDIPSIPAEAQSIFDNKEMFSVIDVGGDDRGALALGRYKDRFDGEDMEMLLVVNKFRPLTRDVESLAEIRREIETASKLKFTGIVNNSNLGRETTAKSVIDSVNFANEVSGALSLPVKMTVAINSLKPELAGVSNVTNIFYIDIFEKTEWKVY